MRRVMSRVAQAGFSLIELMIVIAIIGILASIAIPSYNTYVIKARVTELLALASQPKAVVMENVGANAFTTISGVVAATIGSGYVAATSIGLSSANVTITTGGTVQVTSSNIGGSSGQSITINLMPTITGSGVVSWSCTSSPNTYAPATCK